MRNTTPLTDMLINEASLGQFHTGQSGESSRRIRMKTLLKTAMTLELTERQRRCIQLYYFEEKPVKEIALLMGIRATTVYKHLKTARNILKRISVYL